MMIEQPTLSDVTLTMIVRDELMNHAGGLLPMLEKHLPYFPQAVILDTGSIDGTRQLLEHMAAEYSQLQVHDAKFEGYGPARNTANSYVKTKYSFVLDADEIISSLTDLNEDLNGSLGDDYLFNHGFNGFRFRFREIEPNGEQVIKQNGLLHSRLFSTMGVYFEGEVWEVMDSNESYPPFPFAKKSLINHFVPSKSNKSEKVSSWYSQEPWRYKRSGLAPSSSHHFELWKTPNPTTLRKYGIEVEDIITRLGQLGLRPHEKIMRRLDQMRQSSP